jgi:hypothetical protein
MAAQPTTTERLNKLIASFIDVIWQNIYENKSTMPAALKQQLIEESRIRNQIHDWVNSDRNGAWILAQYADPQADGFYKARDEDGTEGQFHFIYGKWHTLNGKKVTKWWDPKFNQRPCSSCKCKEHEKAELQKQLDTALQETKDLKRDIEFRLAHIIVRDEVLLAFQMANNEIERLKNELSCKEAQSLEHQISELQTRN